jgi:uncharacterized membrane protein
MMNDSCRTFTEYPINHLDLQINLLAEKEATSTLKALHEIAAHLKIRLSEEVENQELTQETPVESIARDLRSKEKQTSPKQ